MVETVSSDRGSLVDLLVETWKAQARDGFLLLDPDEALIETRRSVDPECGVEFRFSWMPHRELRANVGELERRGILNPHRDRGRLFRDPRDAADHHCFLCVENVRECHPREVLVEMSLAGRTFYAGANFAWIERNHFTVMHAHHVDQSYTPEVLAAMLDLHDATDGAFRVLFNGRGAGATIPWHLHLQITTEMFPIEELPVGAEDRYPIPVRRFRPARQGRAEIDEMVEAWLAQDRAHHSVNVLVAGTAGDPEVLVIPRHRRFSIASNKGLVGGFEVAGAFVYSEDDKRGEFERADVTTARKALAEVRPPALR